MFENESTSDLDMPSDLQSLVTPELAEALAQAIADEHAQDVTSLISSESDKIENESISDDTGANQQELEASKSPENPKISHSPLSEALAKQGLEASKSPKNPKISHSPLSEALATLAISDRPAKKDPLSEKLSDSSDGKGTPRRGKVRTKAAFQSHESPYKTRSKARLEREKEARSKSEDSGRK